MGGEQALTEAATDARVAAVVAEGATQRTYDDVYATLRGIEKVVGVPQYRALYGLADWLTPAQAPAPLAEAVSSIAPRRVLLLNTQQEAKYGERYAEAGGRSVTLWAPASAEHTRALAENRAEWEQRVVGFLDDALQIEASAKP